MYDYYYGYYQEPNYTPYVIGGLFLCAIFGIVAGYIAKKKGRESYIGYGLLGFFLPIIGLIVALVIEDLSGKGTSGNVQSKQSIVSNINSYRTDFPINEWYLDLPFEIIENQLIVSQDKSRTLLKLVVRNIGEKSIRSVYFKFECFDDTGEPSCSNNILEYAYQDMSVKMHEQFGQSTFIELPDSKTRNINIIFDKIAFTDGSILKISDICEKESLIEPVDTLSYDEKRAVNDSLKDSKFSSQYKPIFQQDGKWMCTCGRTNARNEKCSRCGRDKDDVRIEYDDVTLKIRIDEKKSQEEQAHRIRTSKYEKNKKKFLRISLPIIGAIMIFILVYIFYPRCADIAGVYELDGAYKTTSDYYDYDTDFDYDDYYYINYDEGTFFIKANGSVKFPYYSNGEYKIGRGRIKENNTEERSATHHKYKIENSKLNIGVDITDYTVKADEADLYIDFYEDGKDISLHYYFTKKD